MSHINAHYINVLNRAGNSLDRLMERIAVLEKENTYLRAHVLKLGCTYGNLNENGVCKLGYPGCGCMDDLMAAFNIHDIGDISNSESVVEFSAMPRDPNRIPRILEQIEIIWRKNPDMRLCQLISNYVNDARDHVKFYNQEDTVTEHLLEGVVNDLE